MQLSGAQLCITYLVSRSNYVFQNSIKFVERISLYSRFGWLELLSELCLKFDPRYYDLGLVHFLFFFIIILILPSETPTIHILFA